MTGNRPVWRPDAPEPEDMGRSGHSRVLAWLRGDVRSTTSTDYEDKVEQEADPDLFSFDDRGGIEDLTSFGTERQQRALERLTTAVQQGSECLLSNVIYDSAEDGYTVPDGEGGEDTPDWGFDCDDLAAVLLPLLQPVLSGTVEEGRKP